MGNATAAWREESRHRHKNWNPLNYNDLARIAQQRRAFIIEKFTSENFSPWKLFCLFVLYNTSHIISMHICRVYTKFMKYVLLHFMFLSWQFELQKFCCVKGSLWIRKLHYNRNAKKYLFFGTVGCLVEPRGSSALLPNPIFNLILQF